MDGPPEADSGSKQNVYRYVTNITGPIQGTVYMGNEFKSASADHAGFGGSGRLPLTPFNEGVPLLKPSGAVITTDDGVVTVGGALLHHSRSTVSEAKQITLTYQVNMSAPPEGLMRASSLLTCNPALSGRRLVEVCLPTFCSTRRSVPASVYRRDNEGQWQFVEEDLLKDDRQIFVSDREISNMAAFIPKEQVADIDYSIACFLFNNANGEFIMGFCLDDEAIKAAFCHRIKSNGFIETVHIPDVLQTHLGDQIEFKISPGQAMPNTKMTIDETFVFGVEGFTSVCKLNKDAVHPQYYITLCRNGQEIDDYVYGVKTEESKNVGARREVEFLDSADIGNMISKVEYAEIDQRKYLGDKGDVKENDKVRFSWDEELSKKNPSYCEKKPKRKPRLDPTVTPRGMAGIVFHGTPRIGNFIHDAQHVKIDQRVMSPKIRRSSVERIVQAKHPEHEKSDRNSTQTTSAVVAASGDVGVKAEPTTFDCTEDTKEGTTIHEAGNVEAQAGPIYDDEKKPGPIAERGETINSDVQPTANNSEEEANGKKPARSADDHKESQSGENDRLVRRRKEILLSEDSSMELSSYPVDNGDSQTKGEHPEANHPLDKAYISMIIVVLVLLSMVSFVVISSR